MRASPPGSSFKPFCRIRHCRSEAELTLLLINRPRFESLARRVKTQPARRVEFILLPSTDASKMCETGTSHCTWPGGKTLVYVKTSYEPTMEGPLLAISIQGIDANHRNWILVQDTLHQTVINLADIFNTLNGRLMEGEPLICATSACSWRYMHLVQLPKRLAILTRKSWGGWFRLRVENWQYLFNEPWHAASSSALPERSCSRPRRTSEFVGGGHSPPSSWCSTACCPPTILFGWVVSYVSRLLHGCCSACNIG